MTLDNLNVGDSAKIIKLNSTGIMRRRLMDVGFVPGEIVKCVLSSPAFNPKAYLVKGSIIALRNSDGAMIEVDII